jgi:hypothetical protein
MPAVIADLACDSAVAGLHQLCGLGHDEVCQAVARRNARGVGLGAQKMVVRELVAV